MEVGLASPPPQPKKTLDYTKNNEILPQRQDTTVINHYSAGEYDVNETTLQK